MVFHMHKKRKTKVHGHSLATEFMHQSLTCQIRISLVYKWVAAAAFTIPETRPLWQDDSLDFADLLKI